MGAEGLQLSSLNTSAQPIQLCTAGLDDALQGVIDDRCVPTITFIKQHLPPLILDVDEFQRATEHPQLQAFSTTLVQELHLIEAIQKTAIQRCLKRGWLWVCVWLRTFFDTSPFSLAGLV
jgi:hypothetical protein